MRVLKSFSGIVQAIGDILEKNKAWLRVACSGVMLLMQGLRNRPVRNGTMALIDLIDADAEQREEAARILLEALFHVPSAWRDIESATREVHSFLGNPERFAFLGVEFGAVRGWIGAIRHSRTSWELHPLVVDPKFQRQGWGTRLVKGLEATARAEGVVTIWLGTDDDFGGTNIYGRDLYPDVLEQMMRLRPTTGHPFTFYQRLGYTVCGVLPDADGFGKHDILMAKRVAQVSP
jgi:aminoglycoside 6'-N-acetyltransferase I